jgi:type IV secretion system protein VirD4
LAARPNHSSSQSDVAFAAVIIAMAGAASVLWLAAWLIASVRGAARPRYALAYVARLIGDPLHPSKAFGVSVASPWLYWGTGFLLVCAVAAVVMACYRLVRAMSSETVRGHGTYGLASTGDVSSTAGSRSVLRRARTVRPDLEKPRPADVGYAVGRNRRRAVWVSVEDSLVILGPPRSGKGLHLVIPMILDSPGAVLTTSTRPDNLAATLRARRERGPVGVFDPQKLVPGVSSVFRWSPIRGCESPQTAMIRSRALAAGTTNGLEGGDFWQAQTESVLRGVLHAAALDGRSASDLYRWSLSASAATEAVRILSGNDRAADGWADGLGACIAADPRTRDSIWVGVRTALACLADPRVLDAVSPAPGDQLDPQAS